MYSTIARFFGFGQSFDLYSTFIYRQNYPPSFRHSLSVFVIIIFFVLGPSHPLIVCSLIERNEWNDEKTNH